MLYPTGKMGVEHRHAGRGRTSRSDQGDPAKTMAAFKMKSVHEDKEDGRTYKITAHKQ